MLQKLDTFHFKYFWKCIQSKCTDMNHLKHISFSSIFSLLHQFSVNNFVYFHSSIQNRKENTFAIFIPPYKE